MHTTTFRTRQATRTHQHSLAGRGSRLRYKHLAFGVGLALGSLLVCGVATAGAGVAATASPTGGQVVGGVGTITQQGASTIVAQQSKLLSLNWQTFNVGKDASVLFKQPGVSAVALNRILDQNPSQIFGKINSNGQVFLINTHGIIFGSSAQLNVGGLVASTLDLTPNDFLAQHFNLDAHGGSAGVVNHGTIAAASGGSVSLIGGQVQNDGVIVADYGHINLDGADQAVLNFDGDGLINVTLTGALKQRLDADQAAVVNNGTLRADSGTVVLQASAAKNLFTNLVNNSGVIDAHGISTAGGVVRLVGSGGDVIDSGTIDVSGTTGGSARLLSDQNVGVMGGTINASGTNGGGSIRVGGGWQGGEGLQTASATYVAPDATLDASATRLGNGGSVVVWGNNVNNFYGSIFARGGALGGNGGQVETSSHYGLNAQGSVDASAPNGQAGLWLLDPYDVDIVSTGTGALTNDPPNGKYFSATSAISNIAPSIIDAALTGNTNVSIFTGASGSQNGDITVSDPIVAGGAGTLSLQAAGSIFLNADISGDGTHPLNVNLWANYGGVAGGTSYSSPTTGCTATSGCVVNIGDANAATITTDGGNLDIETGTGGGALNIGNGANTGNIDTGSGGNLTVNTSGINQESGSVTVGGTSTLDTGTGNIALAMSGNSFGGAITINGAGAVELNGIGTLDIAAVANTGSLTLDGASKLDGNITTSGAQTYNGTVVLGTAVIATSTGNDNINFASTVDGPYALTVDTGGLTTFGGVVGGGAALTSLTTDTGGGTALDANVTTSGAQTYNDAVALGGAVTLTGSNVTLQGVTGNSNNLTVIGNAALRGVLSGVNSLSISGATALGANVTTASSQTYTGAVTLDNDVILTSTAGSVSFGGKVDSQNTTARSLEVDAATGLASFGGAIGGTHQLNDLTVNSNTLTIPATLSVAGNLSITTVAALTSGSSWSGANVTLDSSGDLTLGGDVQATGATGTVTLTSGGNIGQSAGVITASTLTGSSVGSTTLAGVNAINALGAFTAVGFSVTNGQALDVTGTVDAGSGAASLTTNAGDLTIDGTGGNAGSVTGGSVGLTASAGNLAINGAVNSGAGTTTLTQGGTGAITEDVANGVVTAGTLTGTASGDATLNGNNKVTTLGSFGAKNLALTNAAALTVTGPISTTGGTGDISLTTTSGNALAVNQALTGGAITLDSGSDLTVGQDVTGTSVDLAANGNLAINAAVDSGAGITTLTQTGTGNISESGAGTITAGTLTGNSAGSTSLTGNNLVANLGAFTAVGFSLVNGQALNVAGAVDGGTGTSSLTATTGDLTVASTGSVKGSSIGLTASAGNLAVNGTVNSGAGTTTLTQAGAGAITEDATNGKIIAGTLTGSSTGDTTLGGNNQIATLGAFSAKDFTLVDAVNLSVTGPISTTGGTGDVSLTTTAGNTLSVGQMSTGGALTLDSGSDLTVTQNVTGASVNLAANGNLAINAAINSGAGMTTLTQTGTGSISEGGAGTITAGTLTGSSAGSTSLAGNNLVANLGAFTAVGFSLVNGQALNVAGAVDGGTGTSSLTATTGDLTVASTGSVKGSSIGLTASAGNLAVNGTVNSGAGTTTLTQAGAGAITEDATNGKIIAGTLTGTSVGATALNGSNQIANLGNFTAAGFSLTNGQALNVAGAVNTGANQTALTVAGAITEDATNGKITAGALTGSSTGDTTLGGNNQIMTLGSFSAKDFTLVDAANLSVTGPITTTNNAGDISLTTTAGNTLSVGQMSTSGALTLDSGSDLTVAQNVAGASVSLVANGNLVINAAVNSGAGTATLTQTGTGAITEDATNGSITAGTLTGSSIGATTLNGSNQIANLGDFTAAGLSLTNGQALNVAGTVNTGANQTALTATGAITEDAANGKIIAGTLTGSSTGDTTLGGNNQIGELDTFSAKDLTLVNDANLNIVGPISTTGSAGNISFTTTAGHTLDVGQILTGGDITLASGSDLDVVNAVTGSTVNLGANGNLAINAVVDSGAGTTTLTQTGTGAITEDATNGKIIAGQLTGSSAGDTTLSGNNQIAELDAFSARNLTLLNAAALNVAGTITTVGGTGDVNLTTTSGNALTVGQTLTGGAITLDSGSNLTVGQAVTGTAVNLAANGDLAINAAVSSGAGTTTLTQAGTGAITEDAANGKITAGNLTGSSTGDTTLGGNNQIANLGAFSAKDFALVDAANLTVTGPITTTNNAGDISLTTTAGNALNVGQMATGGTLTLDSGSNLTVAQNVSGAAVNLAANGNLAINAAVNSGAGTTTLTQTGTGAITESAGGSITAGTLTGSSVGSTTLGSALNAITYLGPFTAAGFSLTNGSALDVVGAVNAGTGAASLATSSGDLTIANGASVTGGAVGLTASAGNLAINGAVDSGAGTTTLTQAGTGAITEDAANGKITAGSLTGSSTGDTTLGGNNQIANLGAFSAKDFALVDAANLTVTGPITTTNNAGDISLTTTAGNALNVGQMATGGTLTLDSGSNLTVAQNVSGAAVNLAANGNLAINAAVNSGAGTTTLTQTGTGAITEDASNGKIIAGKLTGSSTGDTTLGGNNQIGELDGFSARNLTLVDAHDLNVVGPITTTSGNGAISFTTTPGFALNVGQVLTGGAITLASGKDLSIINSITGSAVNLAANGNLAINAAVASGAGTTTLTQIGTGAITEGAGGSITAGTLTGSSTGATTLANTQNMIGVLAAFNANSFSLADGRALTVQAGATVNGGSSVQLATSGAGSNLAIDGRVQGTQVQLSSSGTIAEGASGLIQAGTLTGGSAGSTSLTATNAIASLGNFSAAGFALTNGQALTVANGATVAGGNATTLVTTGAGSDLTLNGNVSGATMHLVSAGGIGEGANGAVIANTLTGSSTAATSLDGANQIANLGNFSADGFALNNAAALTVATGAVVSGGTATSLTTTGAGSDLTLNGSVAGATTTLTSAGALNEGANGSIQAGTLTGSAVNGAQLTGANAIANLGNFSAQGLALTNGQSLTIVNGATVDGGASTTLTTTGAGGNLVINGNLKGATTTLLAAGAVSEGSNGSLQAGTLAGSSVGSTTLAGGHNNVANLGNYTADGFNLATASGLTVVAGSTVDGGGATTLTTIGAGHDLNLDGRVRGTLTKLTSGGAISEGAAGGIVADTLTGSSVGDTTLKGANQVAGLGAFSARNFYLTDAHALAVGGPLATTGGAGNISLVTTGGSGNTLTVNQAVHGAVITMTSAGDLSVANAIVGTAIGLTANGSLAINAAVDSGSGVVTLTQAGMGSILGGANGGITAGTLTGTSTGATSLGSANQFMDNHVGILGGFAAPGGFSFTNGQTLTLASVNGSAYTVNAGQSPVYLAVQNGDLLQTGNNWLYDSVGTWASTGHIGLASAPIYVMGVSNQTVAAIGLPPAYFYAVDAQGNLLPLTGGNSVNVPTSILSSNSQGVSGHSDHYIDISVITANYRSYGVVQPGVLLPPDQLECAADQASANAQCPENN